MINARAKHRLPVKGDRSHRLAALKRRISRIEGHHVKNADGLAADSAARDEPPLIGEAETRPALHELVASSYLDQPAVRDFALALIAALMHRSSDQQKMVLWCQRRLDSAEFGHLYGPGLKALGLPPERFLMVTGKRDADCLWAMEQGLASRTLLAVVGAVDHVSLTASRRLSLAARAHDSFCFLLPIHQGRDPSAARTRWRVSATPSMPDHLDPKGLGLPTWRLALERSPNGRTGHWTVEWDHAAHHFHLLPHFGSRPAAGRTCPSPEKGGVVAFERTG
jgi:hypothetical protein